MKDGVNGCTSTRINLLLYNLLYVMQMGCIDETDDCISLVYILSLLELHVTLTPGRVLVEQSRK